ncbi:hypothetical protein MLD38_033936 [Melastoma candidum]|uniref:Uncharacterized protein n=1 Tax=Melastoma candidum TaxID=119954 RepID=A0ACB9M845_9MYRT|nr:hypothetical protein MLD38_033936 [Melastoma candidum]
MSPVLAIVLLFVGIVILVLVHICIIEWGFRAATADVGRGGPASGADNGMLSVEDVEMLPSFEFDGSIKDTAGKKSPPNCAVCLDYFKDGDKCRLLPLCKHSFHTECVDRWLVKAPSCPICRSRASSERFSEITGATSASSRGSSWRFSSTSGRSEGLPERETVGHDEATGEGSAVILVEERGNDSVTISDHGNPPETIMVASSVNEPAITSAS